MKIDTAPVSSLDCGPGPGRSRAARDHEPQTRYQTGANPKRPCGVKGQGLKIVAGSEADLKVSAEEHESKKSHDC